MRDLKLKKWSLAVAVAAGIAVAPAIPRAYAAVDNTYEELKLLVDILDYLKENYVEDVKGKD